MKTLNNPRKRHLRIGASLRAGFSLVELLIVIAVIGIIAAIAIPNIASITGTATSSKQARNAQNVASTFASARAAGYVPAAGVNSVDTAIDAITTGVTGANDFSTTTFKVPMSAAEIADLKTVGATYLTFSGAGATAALEYTK